MQVDVTSLGLFSTVAASLFTNLGVTVKTSLPLKILETAATGAFQATPLQMGCTLEGKVTAQDMVCLLHRPLYFCPG